MGDIIRIMTGLFLLLAAQPVWAQEPSAPDRQTAASAEEINAEEKEIAEMVEMLQLLDLIEHIELMEDLDILGGEDTNEKTN